MSPNANWTGFLDAIPYDASAVEGVGYNQPQRGFYGEFFPPTPADPRGRLHGDR